jgi:hypothetical protein
MNINSVSALVNKTPFNSNTYLLEEIEMAKVQTMLTPPVSTGVAMAISDTQLFSNGTDLFFINRDQDSVALT